MNGTRVEFFGDDTIKVEVEELWADVFSTSYQLIKNANLYGFDEIEIKSNPNIHQMVASLTIVEIMLDGVLLQTRHAGLTHEIERLVLNCKQQILEMQQLVMALKNNDRDLYNEAVERIKKQAAF